MDIGCFQSKNVLRIPYSFVSRMLPSELCTKFQMKRPLLLEREVNNRHSQSNGFFLLFQGKEILKQMGAAIDLKDKELKHLQQKSDASRRDQENLVFKLTSEIRSLERTVQRKDAIIDKVKELAAEEANELRRQLMAYADMVQQNQLRPGMVDNHQMKGVPPAHVVDGKSISTF